MPGGLSISAAGLITGTPTTPGTSYFTIHVVDSLAVQGDLLTQIKINPSCGATPINLQDVIWTRVHVNDACTFGTLTAAVCNSWQVHNNTTTCAAASTFLIWNGTICNNGAAYNMTVQAGYASSGLALPPPPYPFRLRVIVNSTTVDSTGDMVTDTPNPLSCTVSIPALQVSTISVQLENLATPDPDLQINNVGNLTILPLTHP